MKKIVFYVFTISVLICSCNSNNDRTINTNAKDTTNISDKELIFYEIKNKVLIREIEMYMDSINNYNYMKKIYSSTFESEWGWLESFNFKYKKNKIVNLIITKFEDITKYTLYYPLNPPSLFYTFSKVNDIMVVISYDYIRDIKLPDSVMWKYMKDYFPEQYELYKKNKDSKSIVSGGGLEWHLTFKNEKLIDKEEVITF